jgi:aminopeptidase N
MKTFIFLVLTMIFSTIPTFSQTVPPIENGVSHELAIWRAKHYSDVRYKLNLTLEKMSPILKGEIQLNVKLKIENGELKTKIDSQFSNLNFPLILDWRKIKGKEDAYSIKGVELNGKSAEFEEINEHLVIKNAVQGENVVKLNFTSPISTSGSAIARYIDKEDGSEYIYSLFVPSDASTAFPVFDQPDLKARFDLFMTIPLKWKAISNTYVECIRVDNFSKELTCRFEETQPISTYVFAFAAGDFEEINEGRTATAKERGENSSSSAVASLPSGRGSASSIYVPKSQAEKFKQHSAEVFRLNRECVKYLEGYFDYKFPFPKYDLVLIPEFPFGGMEHAGATFLRESSIIFPSEPTKNDIISRANLIFHEAAHQWFGDTVTMKWFDDLWLKEGFAEFMAYKTLEKVMPEANAWKAFYERNKQLAYLTDSTKGTTPIYQEIANLSSAKSAYGNIVYRKAPSFLRQAEFTLGENNFQTAVRNFLKKNEFANAQWTDLVREFISVELKDKSRIRNLDSKFQESTKVGINRWANTWVKSRGLPLIKVGENKRAGEIFVLQRDVLSERFNDDLWISNFNILFKYKDGRIIIEQQTLDSGVEEYTLANLEIKEKPVFIFPNYQDYGYGIFLLDEKSRNYIITNVQNEKDDFLRSMMYGSLWDSAREAELDPKDFVELAIKNVGTEKDEMIVSAILSRVNTALNYYIDGRTATAKERSESSDSRVVALLPSGRGSASERDELIAKLETVLINKIHTADTQSQKITFYRAFLNIASSEKGKQVLKEILKGGNATVKERVAGDELTRSLTVAFLPIKTKDKFDIVTKLLILGDKDAPNLLTELEKTETSDDAKRYAYAAKAGIATVENKLKYFNDFVANKEISESWIESAFVSFNSTKHSELTLQYLEKALAELPNLKRNRKIFFVNGWLSAFIGGQKSEQALGIVNKFLADNPKLDKDLRLKILENVDVIERAVKIRSKYK